MGVSYGVHSGDEADRHNGKEHTQFEQAEALQDSQTPDADSPGHTDQKALIDRLSSEVDYLRGQLNKQTHLLAASTAQNSDMVKQLQAPPHERPPLGERVRCMFNRLRKSAPDAHTEADAS